MATDYTASKLPANNGYGQNGFPGASSCTPEDDAACGKSGFLPATVLPTDKSQTRDVGKSGIANTFGMSGPKPSAKV
jgi:hypothetical protein